MIFFLDLTSEENIEKIYEKVIEQCELANEKDIILAADDTFDLKIEDNGTFEVYCLDLEGTMSYAEIEDVRDFVKNENLQRANGFINRLIFLRKELLEHQKSVFYKIQRVLVP